MIIKEIEDLNFGLTFTFNWGSVIRTKEINFIIGIGRHLKALKYYFIYKLEIWISVGMYTGWAIIGAVSYTDTEFQTFFNWNLCDM